MTYTLKQKINDSYRHPQDPDHYDFEEEAEAISKEYYDIFTDEWVIVRDDKHWLDPDYEYGLEDCFLDAWGETFPNGVSPDYTADDAVKDIFLGRNLEKAAKYLHNAMQQSFGEFLDNKIIPKEIDNLIREGKSNMLN